MAYRDNVIRSDDPQAVDKLQSKIAELEKENDFMKKVNAYYRKNGTCKGCEGVTDVTAEKLDNKVANGHSWETSPFAKYRIAGNSQEIRRLKARVEELTQNKELGFVGWKFKGGEAAVNESNNRLQLIFDEKPDADQRANQARACGHRRQAVAVLQTAQNNSRHHRPA